MRTRETGLSTRNGRTGSAASHSPYPSVTLAHSARPQTPHPSCGLGSNALGQGEPPTLDVGASLVQSASPLAGLLDRELVKRRLSPGVGEGDDDRRPGGLARPHGAAEWGRV